MKYLKEIPFAGRIYGEEIEDILGDFVNQRNLAYVKEPGKNPGTFNLGISSENPYDGVRALVGDELEITDIRLDQQYERFAIEHHEWPGQTLSVAMFQPNLGRRIDEIGKEIENSVND